MSQEKPRLRGNLPARSGPYPIGEFTDDIVLQLGKQIVHRLAVGCANVTGDDFAEMFANAISGIHLNKPLGITDIVWESCSWSAKTVQHDNPFNADKVRFISGRNSVNFSYGIENPLEDIQATGAAVLKIWNQRVDQSMVDHEDLRIVGLVRNMDLLNFSLYEYEAMRHVPADYKWKVNQRGNLEALEVTTGVHAFTWQPHGSQFTVIKTVPGSTYKFRINRHPGLLEPRHILNLIKFDDSWIERVT